jgi:hypothetical protein
MYDNTQQSTKKLIRVVVVAAVAVVGILSLV